MRKCWGEILFQTSAFTWGLYKKEPTQTEYNRNRNVRQLWITESHTQEKNMGESECMKEK